MAAPAGGIELVRDVNELTGVESVVPLEPVDLSGLTLFALDDGIHGSELWATNGNPAGTRLVKDINPGSAGSDIKSMVAMGNSAYFWAEDGTNGIELWRSNGSPEGTRIVANITPDDRLVGGIISPPLYVVDGVLYFLDNDDESGEELWRSDGTADGTYLVRDIRPGSAEAGIRDITVVGSRIFFAANDGASGEEVWSTDGTAAGTALVEDINPGTQGSSAGYFLASGGTLYFAASDGGVRQPWRATGDGRGAEKIGTVSFSLQDPLVRNFFPVGDGVAFLASPTSDHLYAAGSTGGFVELEHFPYFGMEDPNSFQIGDRTLFTLRIPRLYGGGRTEIEATDGTPAGTISLGATEPIFDLGFLSSAVTVPDGRTFLFASTSTIPTNIWVTDGTPPGTRVVTDFTHGLSKLELDHVGNDVLFTYGHNVDSAGGEIWITDGNPGGARLLEDIWPGARSSAPSRLRPARGRILFTANDGSHGIEPWITDGTTAGTRGLGDLRFAPSAGGSDPDPILNLGGIQLFTADDGVHGTELWATDGSTAGTQLLADIRPGQDSSNPLYFVDMGSVALFLADDGVTGRELWRTDGTAAGTMQVLDIDPGPAHGDPIQASFGAFVLNGQAYFAVAGGNLWRSDGTPTGTQLFMDLSIPGQSQSTIALGVVGSRGLFSSRVGATPRLWATDGTSGGTAPVSLDVGYGGIEGAVFDGYLYFGGFDVNDDYELWRSDGTPAGTGRVADLNTNGSSSPNGFRTTSDFVAFNACDASCDLYALSSGQSVPEHIAGFSLGGIIASDGHRLFFGSQASANEVIVSDGTAAGTHSYLPATRPFSGPVGPYVYFAGTLVMTVKDTRLGPSIWRSDGTIAETRLVADVDPGRNPDEIPRGYFPAGNRLFLSAREPSTGVELWMLDSSLPSASADQAETDMGQTVRVPVLDNDSVFSGSLDASTVEIVMPPDAGTVTIDAASGDILYTPDTGWSGFDALQYRVADNRGEFSNAAFVGITTRAEVGPGPGDPPAPPPPPPPPPPPDNGGGGGGSTGAGFLLLLIGLSILRRDRSRDLAQVAFAPSVR